MFESVVRTVLNKFLGDYVSNLESNQLNVGIFSGNVVLHGLKLKKEALDKLNLPVMVYQGYLGKLELQIPWTNLKQQPVIVEISDLFLLAGPKIAGDVDPTEGAEKAFKNKMDRLATSELFNIEAAMHGEAAGKVMEETQNESFTTQLVTKIVDNLQVTIKNIHFRYEDAISHPERELFSFGFTLEGLSAFSTDMNWKEAYVAGVVDQIYKMVNLEDLSIYWDSWSQTSLQGLEGKEFLEQFLRIIRLEEDRNHVLCPISGNAKVPISYEMTINKREVEGEPKVKVNLFFDQFAILFDDSQYFDLLNLLNFFVMSTRLHEYRELRPAACRPLDEPLQWLRYVVNAKLREVREINKKRSWTYILERRKDRLAYQDLFFQSLITQPVPPELASQLEDIERRLEYRDLKLYRSIARRQFHKWQEANKEHQAAAGWFGWLLSPGAEAPKPTSIADLVQENDVKELFETIGFDENEQARTSKSPLSQLFQVNFDLGTVSVNIGKADKLSQTVTSVASLVFRLFSGSLTKRTSSMKFEMSLQELLFIENLLENSQFPEIIRSRTTKYELEYDDDVPFFHLAYDQLTDNPDAEASLTLVMQPLEVVVNHQAALLLKEFVFGGRNKDLIDSLMGIAADQLSEFKVWTKASLERVLDEHKGIDFFIDIDAPVLVVPEDSAAPDRFAFVADLGHVKVRSKLVTAEQKKRITVLRDGEALSRVELNSIKDFLYDYLTASLSSLQILYFDNLKDCKRMLKGNSTKSSDSTEYQVIDKVNFDLRIGTCILPLNAELPDVKLRGTVPMINVMFSDEKYKNFMKLLDIFLPSKKDETSSMDLASLLNASTTSLFHDRNTSSPRLILPTQIARSTDSDGEEEEFQDAVENPEDLRIQEKQTYDQTSLDILFVIEHVKGTIVQRIGTKRSIGMVEAETLKVFIENRPWDIVVRTYLKAFKVTELLDEVPRTLIDGHRGDIASPSEVDSGLLSVAVTLVNPLHPLYKSKYSSAGITVDVDFSSLHLTMDPPTIFHLIRFATDTFPTSDDTPPPTEVKRSLSTASMLTRKQSKLERSLSKLSQSAKLMTQAAKVDVDSKILVKIRLMELCLCLGPENNCIGTLNLRSAAMGVTYLGSGKILLQGKLTSFEVIPKDFGIGIYGPFKDLPFATVKGNSVVDFSYETFLPGTEADEAGYDVALILKSGSMHLYYMPQFLRGLFSLLADLRNATAILNKQQQGQSKAYTIDDVTAAPSRFHYEIEVQSPVIEMASPRDPEERMAFYPGNLSVSNSFRLDKSSGLFDAYIDVALRSLHIDVWHHHSPTGPLQQSSMAEPMNIDVRVIQAASPHERNFAPLEIEVSLGAARFSLGDTEYTLVVGLLNWFLATYPSVMENINTFLSSGGGGPTSHAVSPTLVDGEELFAMEVSILIDSIEMSIFKYEAGMEGEATEPIASSDLTFKDIAIDYVSKSAGSSWVEGKIQGIIFTDSRPDPARCFTTMLSLGRGKKDPEAPMVLARYERIAPSKQTITKVTLDTPQMILALDHLFSLKRFFADGLPTGPLVIDQASSVASPGLPSLEDWSSSTMASVARATVYVIEDPYNPASEAIELGLPEILYTSNGTQATFTVDDIKMALLNMDDRDGTRLNFVDPFDLISTIETEAADRVQRYTATLTPIVMRFAYQDIAVFQSLAHQFTSLNAPETQVPVEDAIDETIDEMMRASSITGGGESPRRTPTPFPWKSIYRLNAELFRAVFVDDFSKVNRPFVEWLCDSLSGEFTQSALLPITGQATFTTHLASYNVANSHWEPLVEPMPFTLSLGPKPNETRSPLSDRTGSLEKIPETSPVGSPLASHRSSPAVPSSWYTEAILKSDQGLEAIVTHAFLQQLFEFSARMATSAAVKDTSLTANRQITLPYMIHNGCGVDVEFWVSGTRKSTHGKFDGVATDGEVEKFHVAPEENIPWTSQDWKSLRSSTESVIPMLACRLCDTPFEPVRSIAIDRTGIQSYGLRPKLANGTAHRLIVELVVKNGVKHIYLRPPFIFMNDGKFAVELRDSSEGGEVLVVEPGRTGAFPMTKSIIGEKVLMRPKGLGYDWSETAFEVRSRMFEPEHRKDLLQLSCTHLTDTQIHPPFYYSLYGQLESGRLLPSDSDSDTLADDSQLQWIVGRIHLRAPLQFMNQLPYRIAYRVYDRTCGFDFGAALAPGGLAQLHFVNAQNTIGLSVEIEDADLRSAEISLINGEDRSIVDDTLPMVDSSRIRVELRLAYMVKKGGSRRVALYAPYCIINLTGLPLFLQNNTVVKSNQEIAGVLASNTRTATGQPSPILYAYPESIALRDRIRLSVSGTEWSSPVSMESVGAGDSFDVKCAPHWVNLAMTVHMGPSRYEPCKIVRFLPRFVLVNSTRLVLTVGETEVEPGTQQPFHVDPDLKSHVTLSYLIGSEVILTPRFDVEEIGKVFVKAPGSCTGLLRIDRAMQEGATIFVGVREESTWPWLLINESSLDLRYSQEAWTEKVQPTAQMLLPEETAHFSWDEPSSKDKKLVIEAGNKRIPLDIYDIGQLQPVMIKMPGGQKVSLAIDIVADGPVLQVIFRNWSAKHSLFQQSRRRQSSLNISSSTDITSGNGTGSDYEVKRVEERLSQILCLQLPWIGVTLVNRHLEEVLYAYAKDLQLRLTSSNLYHTYGLTIGWLQLDNQLFDDWDHPILLYPAVISKKAQFKAGATSRDPDSLPPFLSMALIQSVDSAHGVTYYKYGGFLLQEVVIDLGEHLMNKLVDFYKFDLPEESAGGPRGLLSQNDLQLPDMIKLDSDSRDLLYFELLQFHPIKINFSFSKLEGQVYDESEQYASSSSSSPLDAIASAFTTVLGSISNAPLAFNSLVLEHPIVKSYILTTLIQQHYTQQAIGQVHRIIGSADFIGNPVGLFNTFGSGVSDFFYEPLLGLVSDRPGDIGIGLAKGSISLVRKTVVGVTDTFAKLTGSISKGATALTFDPAFQQKRRLLQARNRPKHALGGIMASAKHLFSGVSSGITGIVEKPVEGAKEGGVSGFFKGMGVGVLGVVVKPIVGVFDATTSLTVGLKNTADTDPNEVCQVHLPRAVPYDGVTRPYSEHEARGQAILYALHQRQHQNQLFSSSFGLRREYYVAHLPVPSDEAIALITTEYVYLLEEPPSYRTIWQVHLEQVTYARPHKDVILLVVRQRDFKQRMIFVADPAQQEWFCTQVEQAMLIFNEYRAHSL